MYKTDRSLSYPLAKNTSASGTSSIRQAMMNHRKKLQLSPEVIQRAVGFEIEIGYRPFRDEFHRDATLKSNIPARSLPYKPFERNDVLLKGDGFEVRTDVSTYNQCPYLEIVTDPFEEGPQGLQKLQHIFDTFEEIMMELSETAKKNPHISFNEIFRQYGKIQPQNKEITLWLFDEPDKGYFQVTAGIDLAKIPLLLQDWAWPYEDEDETLLKRRAAGRKIFVDWERENIASYSGIKVLALSLLNINQTINILQNSGMPKEEEKKMTGPVKWSDALAGLLSMLALYLDLAQQKIVAYPKSFAFLLSRTDFVGLFQKLDQEQKDFFSIEENWLTLLQAIIQRLEIGEITDPFFSQGIFHKYGKRFLDKRDVLAPFSRIEWLMQIPKGKDLLTEHYFPIPEYKHWIQSFGEFGKKTDVIYVNGQRKEVPIFEIRFDNHDFVYNQWKEFACQVHEWITALNSGADLKFGETSGQELHQQSP
ncbi:MAG: hypothetical protein MI784_09220 [Cytophagales bacterium]|nr:hypothetical protein [Cytophagales bacterium]